MASLPQRIDCVLSARENEALAFNLIARFSEALESFKTIAIRLLASSPNLIRLAFGAALLQPSDTRAIGYQQLAAFLPYVRLDPENSSDFLYRINRRRASKVVEGAEINRLSTWSVAALVNAQIPLLPAGKAVFTTECFASRVELDINTAQEWKADLPNDLLESLFQELTELAIEIAEQGDRP
ncbi:MAG TPA: hypothetical protein VI837_08815 [Blastocatellia bacterium]|nr:hypothetical protein [Blastocatellia bacterium]